MKTRQRLGGWFLLAGMAAGMAAADSNVVITSFPGNGQVTWQGSNYTGYAVEWASSLSGPWTSTWEQLAWIPGDGTSFTAAVPMFYRVTGYQDPPSTLLLHGDGQDGSTNIIDENGHAVTVYGDTRISTNFSIFGGASLLFDGSGDYLSLPQGTDWAFGTGDFTIDLWLRLTANVDPVQFIGCQQAYVASDWLVSRYSGTLGMNLAVGQLRTAITPAMDTWYHLAATRAGGLLRIFVDGQKRAEQTESGSWGCNYPLTIGRAFNEWGYMAGYLDEIRIVKGLAVWTNDFTPPTHPYGR